MESSPEERVEGLALVHVLANVVEGLVVSNQHAARADPGQVTKFHAMKVPNITIQQYLERIYKYAACSNEVYVMALVYIDRLIQRNNYLLTELNVHRVVITAVLLAAKFFDDAYYNNAYYARTGGVLPCEMNSLEVDFLFRINFSLHVTSDVFFEYRGQLWSHAASKTVIPPALPSQIFHAVTPEIQPQYDPHPSPTFVDQQLMPSILCTPAPEVHHRLVVGAPSTAPPIMHYRNEIQRANTLRIAYEITPSPPAEASRPVDPEVTTEMALQYAPPHLPFHEFAPMQRANTMPVTQQHQGVAPVHKPLAAHPGWGLPQLFPLSSYQERAAAAAAVALLGTAPPAPPMDDTALIENEQQYFAPHENQHRIASDLLNYRHQHTGTAQYEQQQNLIQSMVTGVGL